MASHPLGVVEFPVSCSPRAQEEFNRAVALLHHMTYPQARHAFEQVAATDPQCAMAHWGIAMTLFQPLWPTRPGPADLQRGWNEVQQAQALKPPTERERLFIAATGAFFLDPASNDYWLRIRRWEEASERVYDAFPDDLDAAAFYAVAHLATTPANAVSREHADRAARILLDVYQRQARTPRRHALPGARQRRAGSRARVAGDHAQVRVARAAQSACAAHAHAHLHAPGRLGRGDPRQPARGRSGPGAPGRRQGPVRLGRVSPRHRVPRLRLPATGRG